MTIINKQILEEKIQNGYEFKLSEYISNGFELFKKDMGTFIISFLVLILTAWIPYIGVCIMANFLTICYKIDHNIPTGVGDLFEFSKSWNHFKLWLILLAATLVLILPIYIPLILKAIKAESEGNNTDAAMMTNFGLFFGLYFLILFLVLIFHTFLIYTTALVHFGDFGAREAIKTSFKLAKKNFFMIVLFLFINSILSSLGAMACYIGLLVSIPFVYCIKYQLFKDILFSDHQIQQEINSIQGI